MLELPQAQGQGTVSKFRPIFTTDIVQCDRVKPCGACCLRGDPSGCEYSANGQDRHYIEQYALIEELWRSCDSLKQQLADARDNRASTQHPHSTEGADPKPSVAEMERVHRLASASRSRAPVLDGNRKMAMDASASQLIEVFVERFIDDFGPSRASNAGNVVGWRRAAEMRVFSPLLSRAFSAAALTLAGCRDQNRSLQKAGHVRYVRVLRLLQDALLRPADSVSTAVLIVVVLFTVIEAFKKTSTESVFQHQLGGLELLRLRTPYRHRFGLERSLFVDLRLYWVRRLHPRRF